MTKWHTHLHVAGFAGENNYRLLSGSRFLGLCDSGSGVHSLFHTKRHNLKKKKKNTASPTKMDVSFPEEGEEMFDLWLAK